MYSVKGIFSLYLFPLADVSKKFPIAFAPPIDAGMMCSIVPVEAIKSLRAISACVRFEYFTINAFLLLSDVGKKSALFLISERISRSFSFGVMFSSEVKKTFRLKNILSLNVGRSLVQNEGFDGSGTNCGGGGLYASNLYLSPLPVKKISPIEENPKARQAFSRYYARTNSFWAKAIRRIKRTLKGDFGA